MKKIIYIITLLILSSLSFVSCTDEVVTPTTTTSNEGGAAQEKERD